MADFVFNGVVENYELLHQRPPTTEAKELASRLGTEFALGYLASKVNLNAISVNDFDDQVVETIGWLDPSRRPDGEIYTSFFIKAREVLTYIEDCLKVEKTELDDTTVEAVHKLLEQRSVTSQA